METRKPQTPDTSQNRFQRLLDLKNRQLEAIKKMFILMTEVSDPNVLIRDMLGIAKETLYANGDLTFYAEIEERSIAVPAFNRKGLSGLFDELRDRYGFDTASVMIDTGAEKTGSLGELGESYSTVLFTPVRHEGKTFGFLAVYSIEAITLTEDEEIFLQYICQAMGSYICNRWFEQLNNDPQYLQQRIEELNAIYSVSQAINSSIDIDSLLDQALNAILSQKAFRLDNRGGIFLVNDDDTLLELVCERNMRPADVEPLRLPMDAGMCGRALREKSIIITDHCPRDKDCPLCGHLIEDHGHIVLPLSSAAGIIGALCLFLPPGRAATEQQVEILSAVAGQLALAVTNAKLYAFAKYNSFHDPLTGLGNRNLLETRLHEDMSRARRYGTHFSIAMIDVDHFKSLNDRYGHLAGDHFLKELAAILKEKARKSDIVARYGGEEFTIIMPSTPGEQAMIFLDRLRAIVARHDFPIDGQEGHVRLTISIGVADSRHCEGDSAKAILRLADQALYEAKEQGRNRVVYHLPEPDNT